MSCASSFYYAWSIHLSTVQWGEIKLNALSHCQKGWVKWHSLLYIRRCVLCVARCVLHAMQVRKQIGAYDPLDGLPDKELLCLGVVSDMVAGSKGTEARGCSHMYGVIWCRCVPLHIHCLHLHFHIYLAPPPDWWDCHHCGDAISAVCGIMILFINHLNKSTWSYVW